MKTNDKKTSELVQDTFSRIACPLDGNSLYETLEAAIQRAYELGIQRAASLMTAIPVVLPNRDAA